MSDLKTAVEDSRIDARKLWLPASLIVGTVTAFLLTCSAGLVGVGWWLKGVQETQVGQATTAAQLTDVTEKLDKLQGSVETLLSMQGSLAETRAEVGSLESRLDSFDTRLQTMDAWIQTTRERLSEAGVRPPPYQPQGG